MNKDNAIVWEGITQYYQGKDTPALRQISLEVPLGAVYGVMGRNGSGKSTLMKLAAGLLAPTQGEVWIKGIPLDPEFFRQGHYIAYMTQNSLTLNALKVHEALSWFNDCYAHSRVSRKQIREVVDRFGLESCLSQPIRSLSGGQSRLVQFVLAVMNPSDIVILDEPTNELDPFHRRSVWEMISELANQGKTVIVVSHNIVEVQEYITHVCMLDAGSLIIHGSVSEVIAHYSDQYVVRVSRVAVNHDMSLDNNEILNRDEQKVILDRRKVISYLSTIMEQEDCDIAVRKSSIEEVFLEKLK